MMRPPRGRLALWIFVLAAIKHASSSEADKFRRALRQDFLLGSEGQVDIVFLVDQSQSMSLVNGAVDTVFSFIKSLLVDFHIGKDYARVAVVTYSTTVSVSYNSIPDGDESVDLDKCQLFSEIDKIPREAKGWTATTDALRESRKILENSRPEAEKRIFLITDGPSDIGEKPTVASRELLSLVWNDNITSQLRIFAVGFGDAEYEELLSITSNESFAIHLNSFDEFRIFAVQFNTDKEENSWKTVEIDNCKSTCGDNAVCLCGLDIGVYQCVCDTGHQGSGADCEECPLGSYKSERTPEPCQPCPNGRTTYTVGATDVDHCVCPLGYSSDLRNGCRVTTCQALPVVEHSTSFHVSGIVLSETANTGQVCDNTVYNSCHFECNHGYRLVSSRAVTCLPFINGTGYWYGDLPACEEIQCPQVPDVGIGGVIQYSSGGPLKYPVGSTINAICYPGFISYGDLLRTCTDAGIWDGTPTQCRAQECPALFSIKHTTVNPENCTTARHEIGTVCQYSCGDGFTMNGTGTSSYFTKTCLDRGEWTNHGLYGECVDFEPPEIVCPNDIHDTVDLNKATRLLHWDLHRPNATDNSGIVHLTLLSPYSSPYEFPVGTHSLTWQAEDEAGLSDRCSYNVVIQDRPPVVVFCPEDFTNKTSNSSGTHVDWPYPEYNDGHGNSIPASDITCLNGAYPGQFVSLGHHNIQCYPTGHPTVTCEFSFLLEAYDCTPPAPPLNGSRNCAAAPHSGYQQICTIFCHVESDFARTPADRNLYRCDYSGLWTCEGVDQCLPWPDCSKKYLSGTARVSSESYYFHDDCENSKDEIRRSFLEQYGPSNITCGDATDDFSCSVENVVVECGDFTSDRKRRESPQLKKIRSQRQNDWNVDHESLRPDDSDKPMRARRAVIGNTRVSFQINIVITSVVITENAQYDLYDLSIDVYYELEAVQQRGIDLVINNQVFAQSESSLSFQGVIAQCEIGQVERTYSGEAAECINCAKGTFWESKSVCSPCARGFYQDEEKQTGCKACPDSKTTLIEGATDLEDCKDYCETGHWSDSGLEPCSPCNIGHYQDKEGRSFCHKCPSASTTTEAGSTARSSCISFCSPGTFSVNGLSPCQPCPRHHYQSAMRQTNCMECPGYRETVSMGTSSEGDCIFVDDCQSSPCQNGGLCRDMIGFYICICDVGFQGTDCEIDIDECQSNPCKNDAICVDQPNGYNCTCIPGFAGTNCDEDVDECLSSPCYRGTCINEVNGFQCVCPDDYHGDLCDKEQTLCVKCVHGYCNGTNCICDDGFTGVSCDVDIDDCLSEPCMNGGTCQDQVGNFVCQCIPGYTGDICDVEIDECASNPCQNEIMCHDEINKYRCQCKPSYTGPNCLTRKSMNFDLVFTGNMAEYVEVAASDLQIVDELSICLWLQTQDVDNYGTIFSYTTPNASVGLFDYRNLKFAAGNNVIQLNISVNDGVWHHLCVTWTHTEQGLAKLKICKDGICVRELNVPQLQTGGTLTVGQFKAIASGGFMQQRSFIGDMSRLHIYNSALSDQNIGQLAEKLTPCSLRYIHEDSLIVAWPDLLESLSDGLKAVMYREESHCGDVNECLDVTICDGTNRMCVNKIFENPGYVCDCLLGYVGDDCQYVIDNCLPTNPCQNEGSCTNMIGDYLCDCQPGYGEKNCDTQIDYCLSNPCQHGGTCHTELNSYTCTCPDPERQTGINCEILDLCIGNQCRNGATCVPGTASYTCNCLQGYTGLHCDILIDYCQPDPCYNNGICESSLSGFTCHCQDSYTGDYCQTLFSPCHLAVTPCLNGGTCKTDYNLADKYWCECRDARFHPPNCDLVNPCSESPCQNDAICVISENANRGYLCACQPNFYGASCETYIEPTQPPVIEDICIFKPCKNDGICIAIAGQDYDCDCSNVPFFGIICHLYTRLRQYDGRLKITNKEFNDGLIADEDFKKSFGKAMSNVFVEVKGKVTVNVTSVTQGSVIMEYNMIHEANVSHDSEMANQEQMAAILNEALQSGSMPPFTVSSDTFILTPKECDPGSWSETGTYPCTPCDRGFYQPNKGATKCEACPDDQVTDDVGARNHTQCKGINENGTPTTIIVIVVVCVLVIIIISVLIGFCIYIKIMKGKPHQKSGRESLPSAYSEIPEVTPITPYAEYHSEHDLHESPPRHVTSRPQPKPPVEDQAMDYREGGYLVPQDIAKASQEDRGEYLAMNPGKTDGGYQKLIKDAEDNPSTITLEKDVPQSHQNINKKNEYKDYRDSNYLTPLDTRKLQEGDYTRMSGTTDDWYQKLNSDASGKVNEEYQKLQRNEEGGVQHVYLHFNNPVAKQDWDKDIEMEIMNK